MFLMRRGNPEEGFLNEVKAQVVPECLQPEVSIASIALRYGIIPTWYVNRYRSIAIVRRPTIFT